MTGTATVWGPRALAARVVVTEVQTSDWRMKATGGVTAPAAASVTRPLTVRLRSLRDRSLGRYGPTGVTVCRTSIVSEGPDVEVAAAKVSGADTVIGSTVVTEGIQMLTLALSAPPAPVVTLWTPKVNGMIDGLPRTGRSSIWPVPWPAGQVVAYPDPSGPGRRSRPWPPSRRGTRRGAAGPGR